MIQADYESELKLIKYIPYLTLTGEISGTYCDAFVKKNMSWYDYTELYWEYNRIRQAYSLIFFFAGKCSRWELRGKH